MKATNLSVKYGKREIISGLDFEAKAGEITAIIGPNGSGKSTLLKAMCDDVPRGGDVFLNGQAVSQISPAEMAGLRGVMAQHTQVAFSFTVSEILSFGLEAGLHAGEPDLMQKALRKVELTGYENRPYDFLSGGEQQRVMLARALLQIWQPVIDGVPRWFILDEPVSSLDIGHQFTVMDALRDYARAGGGVIAVMHDLNLTAMFADHIVLMKTGKVIARGTPSNVITQETLSRAYGARIRVNSPGPQNTPYLLPQAR